MMTEKNRLGVSKRFGYINDYEMRTVTGPNGKTVRKAVYIGPYMVPDHTDCQYTTDRVAVIVAAAITVCALAALLLVSEYAVYRHGGLYALVPAVMCLFPCAYLVMGVCALPAQNTRMQRDRYNHSVRRLQRATVGVLVLSSLSILLSLVFALANATPVLGWWDLAYIIFLLAPCASSLYCIVLQRRIVFSLTAAQASSVNHADA